MSKILYPVGTAVRVRDWYNEQHPEFSTGKRVVLKYIKGSKKPYVLSVPNGKKTPSGTRLSVTQIRAHGGASVEKAVDSHPQDDDRAEPTRPVKSITRDEVNKIVRERVIEAEKCFEEKLRVAISNLHDHAINDADQIARTVVHEHVLTEDQ